MKRYFLTGLVTLLPLAVTIWVVHFLVNFLTKPFIGIVAILTDRLPIASPQLIRTLSQIFILIGIFFLTLFLGFVARKFFFNQMIRLGDRFLDQIPLVGKVYKTSKEIVKSIFGSKERSFSQVVMVPFPYAGSYCIGLIAKAAPRTCSEAEQHELISIFIPTTPNPSTGYLVMCQKSELVYLDMKTEEAIKYVVSCAVIQPEGKQR
ncbi:MAG: DUF502 domain-containing protein [Chlamydiales bacterium]